ncbi:MAG: DUF2779 domain-containing protein [Stellaceae bacterium]
MLSKSDLQSFLQCPRRLWLEKHQSDLVSADDPSLRRRQIDGNIVGDAARKQLGQEFIWPRGVDDRAGAAEQAKQLLQKSPHLPAAEVPMLYGEVYARADALIPNGSAYVLRETKSSTFPLRNDKVTTGEPKDHHLSDLAVQAWVMTQSDLPLARAELNLLNDQWRYPGNGDYGGLFRQLDVTEQIKPRMSEVRELLNRAQEVVSGDMPVVHTGRHCREPYSCPFQEFCGERDPPGPEHPIELLPDLAGKNLARKLRETKGYVSILDPAPEELSGTQAALYRRMQEAHRTGCPVLEPGSAEFMAQFRYPRYFLDFEGIDFPVPKWRGVRPYEHIPFQFSCHVETEPGLFHHGEFLDLSGEDPSLGCIRRMQERIDSNDGGPIFVYHATYERSRLAELAERHPEYAELLETYISRLVDLLPIVKNHYYNPDMMGSFSIKKVLPAIAPDLDYAELDEVQEGTGAQVAYITAAFDDRITPERKAELEKRLRAYCRQDTWAMVEVAYFLGCAGKPPRPAGM